jgi:hypothetical protein
MCEARIAAVVVLFTAGSLLAQVTGRVTGTVLDPTGASVPNARVGLYLPDGKSALLTTATNAEGIFDFIAVRPDLYRLQIEAPGFTTFQREEVKVDPARELTVPPITLSLAATGQAVEVSTSVTALDTSTAEVSATVTQSQIVNLPVLNRSIVGLFNTQAGVTQNNRQNTVINGMRPSYSNITMDGILVQDSVRTNDLDLINNRFTIAQVAEFTVSTTNASPTLGGGSSTIVLTTPSGTNQLHGSGYWFNRNNYFASNDWFNNKNGIARPFLNLNQLGGTAGGAIIKDKLFYWGAYEAYRLKRQSPKTLTIPTPTARQGILQYPVGGAIQQFNVLQASNLQASPFVQDLLKQVPAVGNNNAIGDGLNTTGYTFNARNNTTRDNVTGKGDYNLSPKHAFSVTYAWNRDVPDRTTDGNGTTTGGFYTVVPPTYNDNHVTLVSGSWRWSPKATFTNELRGGFDFSYIPFVTRQQAPPYFVTNFFFASPLETAELGEGRNIHQYNIQDNAQWVRGKHTISFGFQTSLATVYSWNYNGTAVTNAVTPVYSIGISSNSPYGFTLGSIPGANSTYVNTANNILASIAGLINTGGQLFNVTSRTSGFVAGAPSIQNQRWDQYALYAVDNFKISRRLTLTLGLRWDYFAPVDETDGLAIAPVPINNNGPATLLGNASLDFAGTSAGHPFYKKDLNNFAPNLALAWDPFGNGRTAVRAGFNIAYVNDNHINSVYNAVGVNNGLNSARQVSNLNGFADTVGTANKIPTPPFGIPTTTLDQFNLSPTSPPVEGLVDPNLATPYVEQWVVSIQHEVRNWTFEGRYVGNHGVKMFRGIDFNQINVRQGDLIADFTRARSNGFLAANAGGSFNPAYNASIPGSQPLTVLSKLPAQALTNSTLVGYIRTGEIGTYAQNVQALYPYPQLGFSYFPNPYLLYAVEMTNQSTSNYNGLQLEVRRRLRDFQFQANYTFSKALTDANAFRGLDPQIDNASPTVERARADYDLTHTFKFNHYIPLPIGTGHRFNSSNAVLKRVLDGWALSGFGVIQTGSPVSILSVRGTINRGARSGQNTVDTNATLDQLHQYTGLFMTGNGPYWLDPSHINPSDTRGVAADGAAPFAGQIFFNPQPGTQGSLQKRALDGPPFRTYNLAVVKTFAIRERHTLEFHADFFNVFNHPNFYLGDQTVNNASFGRITQQNTSNDGVGPRLIQYGLYYKF